MKDKYVIMHEQGELETGASGGKLSNDRLPGRLIAPHDSSRKDRELPLGKRHNPQIPSNLVLYAKSVNAMSNVIEPIDLEPRPIGMAGAITGLPGSHRNRPHVG